MIYSIQIDFVWFEAFSRGENGVFERLVRYSHTVSGVQPVNRGGRFAFWSSEQMWPFGVRQASGGRKADHYGWYAGIDADNDEGISILFEQAEVSCKCLHCVYRLRDIAAGLDICYYS